MSIICKKAIKEDLLKINNLKEYINSCIKDNFKFDYFTILKHLYLIDIIDGEDFKESLEYIPDIHKTIDIKELKFKIYIENDENVEKESFEILEDCDFFFVETKTKNNIKSLHIQERLNKLYYTYSFQFDKNNDLFTYSDGNNYFNRYIEREDLNDFVFQKIENGCKTIKYSIGSINIDFIKKRYSNNIVKTQIILKENLFNEDFFNLKICFDETIIGTKVTKKFYYKDREKKVNLNKYEKNRLLSNLVRDVIFMNSENFIIADKQDYTNIKSASGFSNILKYRDLFKDVINYV